MIRSLSLRNFKCFADQTLHLGGLTLLSGLNGMGKSSVMQSLLLLRQSYLQGTLPHTGVVLNGDLVRLGTAQDVLYEDALEDRIEIEVQWNDDQQARFVLDYDKDLLLLGLSSPPVETTIFEQNLFTDKFHYLQAERLGPRTAFGQSDIQVRQHNQLGSAGEYAAHYLDLNRDVKIADDLLAHPTSESKLLLQQVQAWLSEISPGTEIQLTPHPEMDLVNLQFSFVTGRQRSNAYRSTSVGFGITYTLPILIAILSSSPGTLLLVENPEAHLHPQGQVRMGDLLARAAAVGIQVVVETHSDHVLNGIRLAVYQGVLPHEQVTIHYFTRIEQGDQVMSKVVSPLLDRDGRIDNWPDGFFDEWDRSLEALMAPRE